MIASGGPVSPFQWAPLAGAVLFLVASYVKAAFDPKYAARIREIRENGNRRNRFWSYRRLSYQALWLFGTLGVLFVDHVVTRITAAWHFSAGQEVALFLAALGALVISGFFANRWLNRYWQARYPAAMPD